MAIYISIAVPNMSMLQERNINGTLLKLSADSRICQNNQLLDAFLMQSAGGPQPVAHKQRKSHDPASLITSVLSLRGKSRNRKLILVFYILNQYGLFLCRLRKLFKLCYATRYFCNVLCLRRWVQMEI